MIISKCVLPEHLSLGVQFKKYKTTDLYAHFLSSLFFISKTKLKWWRNTVFSSKEWPRLNKWRKVVFQCFFPLLLPISLLHNNNKERESCHFLSRWHKYCTCDKMQAFMLSISVEDLACLSPIPDPIFSVPDPGSKRHRIPDPQQSIFNPQKLLLSSWNCDPGC
jgi:hypothetical protein